ncbi:hypothetical protein ACU686_13285 [Yinghuangia aomiensis]
MDDETPVDPATHAHETIRHVLKSYGDQINAARSTDPIDEDLLRSLVEQRAAARRDQLALEHADPADVARIAARYEALLAVLTGDQPSA